MSDLPKPDYARNMRLVGHSDQGGRPDGVQIMVHRGFAYVGHMFSKGFSIIDVRDPKNPRPVNYLAAPPNTWNIHLQTHDDLLLVINAKDMFAAAEFADEKAYYKGQLGKAVGTAEAKRHARLDRGPGGLRHLQARRAAPDRLHAGRGRRHPPHLVHRRPLGLCLGADRRLHRLHLHHHRHERPDEAARSRTLVDPRHEPGGRRDADWPAARRFGLHHAIIHGDTAYAAWRDAGMVVLDVADRAKPKLIVHRNWAPPFGGGTHNCLPLPDRDLLVVLDEAVLDHQEDGVKLIWVFDNRVKSNPVSIATFPPPAEADYKAKGGHFGPHNIHENRPGSFVSARVDLRHLSERRRARVRHVESHSGRRRSAPGAAAPATHDRHAAEPRARDPVGRCVRRCRRADLRHRLQCRAVHPGIRRLNSVTRSSSGTSASDTSKLA